MNKRKRFQSGSEILSEYVPNYVRETPGLEKLSKIESEKLVSDFRLEIREGIEGVQNMSKKKADR